MDQGQSEKTICSLADSEFSYAFKFRKTQNNFNDLWSMKSSARESLRDWLIASGFGLKTADNCANACSEMIENCVKFSTVDTLSSVSIRISDQLVVIETFNETQKEHKIKALSMFKTLESTTDPRELFAQKLLTPSKGQSQLGIMKIKLETKGNIMSLETDDDEALCVRLEIQGFRSD